MAVMLGMGCDRNTPLVTLKQAVGNALAEAGMTPADVRGIATIDKKNDEVALLALSEESGWPLRFFTAEQLAQVEVPNPSEVVMRYMGTPAVSEAAAILAADVDQTFLIVEKYKYRGDDGKNATVSVVRMKDE